MTRLGAWQKWVLEQTDSYKVIAWSQIQPVGAARAYAGSYRRRFVALGSVPGYEVGAFGPRGGLALRKVG